MWWDVGIADQQKQRNKVELIAKICSVYNPTLHIICRDSADMQKIMIIPKKSLKISQTVSLYNNILFIFECSPPPPPAPSSSRKARKQGRDDSIKQFGTQLHPDCIFNVERYVVWGCIQNSFMLSFLPCFAALCWTAIPTYCEDCLWSLHSNGGLVRGGVASVLASSLPGFIWENYWIKPDHPQISLLQQFLKSSGSTPFCQFYGYPTPV